MTLMMQFSETFYLALHRRTNLFSVIPKDVAHVRHPTVVDVELSDAQHPVELDPLDEDRKRNGSEGDGDADAERVLGGGADRLSNAQEDCRRETGGCRRQRYVSGSRLGGWKTAGDEILDVRDVVDDVTAGSSDNVDDGGGDVRRRPFVVPDLTVNLKAL